MKKALFLVLAVVMTLAGCSKEDTNTPVGPDPIVGTWYQIKQKKIIDGEVTIFPMSACQKKNNLVIKEDGIMLSTYYYKDDNECKLDGSAKIEWMKNENDAYTFTHIQDDGYKTVVVLEEGILTETFTSTVEGVVEQYIEIYSRTPDKSGDDNVVQDSIIGKWDYIARIEFMDGEQQPTRELSDCETKSSIEFNADGSGTSEWYDNGNGGCIGGELMAFTWSHEEDTVFYRLSTEDGANVQYIKFTFEGDKMKMIETSTSGGVEYTRIEIMTRVE